MNKKELSYCKSPKALYSDFKTFLFKKKAKNITLTLEEYCEIREQPCHSCSLQPTKFIGIGVTCVDFTNVNKYTVLPVCHRCRCKKAIEAFDNTKHCRNLIRRAWKRNPMAVLAILLSRTADGAHVCGKCSIKMRAKDFELDHVNPIQPLDSKQLSLDEFSQNVNCPTDNLMVLCKSCHEQKSSLEKRVKARFKKLNKPWSIELYNSLVQQIKKELENK